jgi:hypothetical protein
MRKSAAAFTPALSQRLQRLYDFVPRGCTVADVGADHGLLSVALSGKCKHVWALDASKLALEGARSLVLSMNLANRISIGLGHGIQPLLSAKKSNVAYADNCDTVVTAGMGPSTVLQILVNDAMIDMYDFDEQRTGFRRPRTLNLSSLREIGARRVVFQPWPPNFVSLHTLHSAMLDNGWQFENQGVDKEAGAFYITSSLVWPENVRPESTVPSYPTGYTNLEKHSSGVKLLTDTEIFESSPLARDCLNGTLPPNIKAVWLDYLTKQRKSLKNRIKGHEIAAASRSSEDIYEERPALAQQVEKNVVAVGGGEKGRYTEASKASHYRLAIELDKAIARQLQC